MNSILNILSEYICEDLCIFGITPTFIRINSGTIYMTEISLTSNIDSFIGSACDLHNALILLEDGIEFKKHHEQLIVKNDSLGIKLDPIDCKAQDGPSCAGLILAEIPMNLHLYSVSYNLKSFRIAINKFSGDDLEISINPNGELNIGKFIVFPNSETSCHSETVKINTEYIRKFINTLCNYSIINICISPPSKFIVDNITFYIAPICDEDTKQS